MPAASPKPALRRRRAHTGVRALGFTSRLSAGTFPVVLASLRRGGWLQLVFFRRWLLKNKSGSLGLGPALLRSGLKI